MSTNCVIKIEGIDFACLYKHYDGNPEATLKWLEDFNERFNEQRGDDPDYKFAQLIRSSSKYADKYNLDPSEYTGWGIIPIDKIDDIPSISYHYEYIYILHDNGTVTYKGQE